MTHVLLIENLSISAGEKPILCQMTLAVRQKTLTAIVGPMGGGKSTLFKFLAGALDEKALDIVCGSASYCHKPLGTMGRPGLILQKVREKSPDGSGLADRLAEIQAARTSPEPLLCIDEPTAGLTKQDGIKIMRLIRKVANEKTVLMISHNTREVENYADHVVLIAGGRVATARPARLFFDGKTDELATHFLKTGGLDLPYKNTPVRFLAPEKRVVPDGFSLQPADPAPGVENWLIPDRLSLMALPRDARGHLDLSNLEERVPARHIYHFETTVLKIYSPTGEVDKHFAWNHADNQPDRNLPLSAAICHDLEARLAQGQRVIIDSSFNQSAAASVIGAFLILRGFSPESTLDLVRKKFPQLHLGMRIEHFFWEMDIEFSTRSGSD